MLSANIALLIIDVQNCFLPGGSLAVAEGNQVVPVINNIRATHTSTFTLVVLSQDWHCSNHISFASHHKNKHPNEDIILQYDNKGSLCDYANKTCSEVKYNISQRLWPDHCVMNSSSAEFSTNLTRQSTDFIVRKGHNCEVDSYSAFFDNGQFRHTELNDKLRNSGIDTVFVTGLARDYCVYYTAKDAQDLGYKTYVILDATRPVSEGTGEEAVKDMRNKGIQIINSADLSSVIRKITNSGVVHFSWNILTILMILQALFSFFNIEY